MRLKNLLYTAEDRLIELHDQLTEGGGVRIKGGKVGLVVPPVHGEVEVERVERARQAWADLVEVVTDGLRNSGQLSALRPQGSEDYARFRQEGLTYVSETDITATRVEIPVDEALQEDGLPPVVRVWVSEPDRLPDSHETHPVLGTFLYLVEDLDPVDPPARAWFYSGASALAYVARLAQPDRFEESASLPGRFYDPGEQLGRRSKAHPLKKLEQLGAQVGLPRPIDALYQIRYMTDEQMFVPPGSKHRYRVNDLLGYPLAIWVE